MITGVLAYATSPLWFAVLLLSTYVTCLEAFRGYQYFEPGMYSLFPAWPEYRTGEITLLLTITIVVLLLPKVLGAILVLVDREQRKAFGGTRRILQGLFAEQIFSMLLAPAMMIFHSTFVVTTLFGVVVKWDAQARDDRGITMLEALNRMKWHVVIGVAWGAVILFFAPAFIWWISPVLIGLLASVPLTVWTSRATLGQSARRHGFFLTPEETAPPPELLAIEHPHAIEPVNPAQEFLQVPAPAPLRMEAAPLDRYSFRSFLGRRPPTIGPTGDTSEVLH
jgi:membrane glycosyltransferase